MEELSHSAANKRLAKNTMTLFLRTFFVMLVGLYVSRVLLQVLGVDDFGIYNVVGGIVVLFSFLNSAMAAASQRYITYTFGTGDPNETNKVFSASMTSQIAIDIVLLIVVEVFGLWFLNNKLQIPADRMTAANITFQFTVLTFCVNVVRIPYEATVIAYEKMSFYAIVSILDVLIRLLIVIILQFVNHDKLVTYGLLLFVSSIVLFTVYVYYCKRKFNTCHYYFVRDNKLYKKLFAFTGWSLFGSGANVLTQQGFVFMLNIFYGVVVNAAMGIANQVNSAMTTFINSFQMSYRPQIVKSYAQGDTLHLITLINTSSKMSFALIIMPVLILIFNMPLVLKLWLGEVPEYAVQFCQLILICTTIDSISGSYNAGIMATDKIRNYQMAISISFLLDLIISFILIKAGILPYFVLLSRIATRGCINLLIGLFYLRKLLIFNVKSYAKDVLSRIVLMLLIILPVLFVLYTHYNSWQMLIISSVYVLILGPVSIMVVLFNRRERLYILQLVKQKLVNSH